MLKCPKSLKGMFNPQFDIVLDLNEEFLNWGACPVLFMQGEKKKQEHKKKKKIMDSL